MTGLLILTAAVAITAAAELWAFRKAEQARQIDWPEEK